MGRIDVHSIDKNLIMKVGGCRQTGISNVADQFASLYTLTLANSKTMHVGIACTEPKSMINPDRLSIAAEIHFHPVDQAIGRCVNGRPDGSSKVNAGVQLFDLINRMDAKAE